MGSRPANANDSEARTTALAGGFARPTEAEWLELVDKVLKGASFDRLRSRTAGGLAVEPLYTRANTTVPEGGVPGSAPFVRGSSAPTGAVTGWALRVEVDEATPEDSAARALEALERGATELTLDLRSMVARGAMAGVDDLDRALAGVLVDIAPLHLRSGEHFATTAGWLRELWSRRGVAAGTASGGFGADPLGTLAAQGSLEVTVESALAALGELAASTAVDLPLVRAIRVDSTPYANAGADEVRELALVLATGAAYLRACSAAGLSADDACRQIEITINTDSDVFTGVAKLRALRRLWDTLTATCGASPAARAPRINVRTAETMMTRRDPWVNLLRVTAASLAAALGGADSLTTLSYDLRLDTRGELGRRLARNTQLLLQEESNLARVSDPMGGSWYIETLTEELATAAWSQFQELEAAGGMPAVLADGTVQRLLAEGVANRFAQIATRKLPLTGVSEFPDINEAPLGAPVEHTSPSAADAATVIDALPTVHWAQPFEELRDRSDAQLAATGERPRVFLVNLGPVAKHTARATFAANFYAAGGIVAASSETGSTSGFSDPATAAADALGSGASLVCICSSDDIYAESAVAVARALRDAELGPIHLAGRPGDLEAALREAGVVEFIHVGSNVVDVLTEVHATLGTPEVNR